MKSSVKITWNTDAIMKKMEDATIKAPREKVSGVRCREHGRTADLGTSVKKEDILSLQFSCCCDGLKQQIQESLQG